MGNFTSPGGKYFTRQRKQLEDIHYAAMYLMPRSTSHTTPEHHTRALRFLMSHTELSQRIETSASFIEFRAKNGAFAKTNPSALHEDNPKMFWRCYLINGTTAHITLATIAVRLYKSVANSVSSE